MATIAVGQVQFAPSNGSYSDPVTVQNAVANAGLTGLVDILGP